MSDKDEGGNNDRDLPYSLRAMVLGRNMLESDVVAHSHFSTMTMALICATRVRRILAKRNNGGLRGPYIIGKKQEAIVARPQPPTIDEPDKNGKPDARPRPAGRNHKLGHADVHLHRMLS